MAAQIWLTDNGVVLTEDGFYLCEEPPECCEDDCDWCEDGTGTAGETVTVEFDFDVAAITNGTCGTCTAYQSTSYELTVPDVLLDNVCRFEGPGECGHWLVHQADDGLDGSNVTLRIWDSQENVDGEGHLLAGFAITNPNEGGNFPCNDGSYVMSGGFLGIQSECGGGTGTATVTL